MMNDENAEDEWRIMQIPYIIWLIMGIYQFKIMQ
jgi:hypothetical protein